jgi:hypothetical protein
MGLERYRDAAGRFEPEPCEHRPPSGRAVVLSDYGYQRRIKPAPNGGEFDRVCPWCGAIVAEGVTPPWPETQNGGSVAL